MSDTKRMPMVALVDEVVLPGVTMRIEFIGKENRDLLKQAWENKERVFVVRYANGKKKFNDISDVCKYGVRCNMTEYKEMIDSQIGRAHV